jgi:hypothetical protein
MESLRSNAERFYRSHAEDTDLFLVAGRLAREDVIDEVEFLVRREG